MSDKLKAADAMAKALRAWMDDPENRDPDAFYVYQALKAYEAAPAEAEQQSEPTLEEIKHWMRSHCEPMNYCSEALMTIGHAETSIRKAKNKEKTP